MATDNKLMLKVFTFSHWGILLKLLP